MQIRIKVLFFWGGGLFNNFSRDNFIISPIYTRVEQVIESQFSMYEKELSKWRYAPQYSKNVQNNKHAKSHLHGLVSHTCSFRHNIGSQLQQNKKLCLSNK